MYIKTDTQRVQRILTATVMAAAIMSALSACGGGGGGSRSASLPGTDIPTNPGGGLPGNGNPGNPGNRATPILAAPPRRPPRPAPCKPPWAIPARPWTTCCLNLGTTLVASARRSIPRSSP